MCMKIDWGVDIEVFSFGSLSGGDSFEKDSSCATFAYIKHTNIFFVVVIQSRMSILNRAFVNTPLKVTGVLNNYPKVHHQN